MKYINVVDTAKMVRQALKEAFPGVKFQVKSDKYAGGASIDINYIDGPNVAQVKAVIQIFEGSYFDGNIDYKGNCYAMLNGERVSFGANFIFVNRKFSDEAVQNGLNSFYRRFAGNFKGENQPVATVEDYRKGTIYGKIVPGIVCNGKPIMDFFSRELNSILYKKSYVLKVMPCPTAAKIIDLGTDNYGQSGRQLKEVA